MPFELSDLGNIVRIELSEHQQPSYDSDFYKWVQFKVYVKGGRFSGEYIAEFITSDILTFRKEFAKLYDNLSGVALFCDLEGYLEIAIKGDGIGHFEAKIKACDKPGFNENTLTFFINFDQTYINKLTLDLDEIISGFIVK